MPHLSPAVSFTGPASAESIGTTYLPHIQMKPDIAGEGVTSRYLSSPMHAPHPFLDRKRHRGVDQEVKPGGPLPPFLLSDAVGNAETPSSRHHFSPHLSGDIPSLLHSVTAHRGSGSPIGRTPPPSSSRHSTPHSFSPQQAYVYPYPPSLTPGLGLTSRPPGPGSVGSAAGGHLNMGSLLNLSPLIGSKKEASLSPGPRLLGSADPPGSGGPSGGGLGGPALAPTSAPLPFSQKGRDDDDGGELDWRSGKRRKADENALDSHARAGGFQPVKFPLGYPDTIPQLANDADYRRLLEVISVTEEGANNVHVLPDTLHPVPDRTTINAYLQAYFTQFHPHLPFLHVPSMSDSLTATPPALFLAILSIGALHDHSHESFVLHVASKSLVHAFLGQTTDFDSRACPLWAMQSILLNMIFGSWSGGAKGLEWTSSIKSLLGNLVSGSRYALRGRIEARQKTVGADGKRHPSWEEWISEESCRRTIFAVFIFFGLLSMVFNQPNSMIVGDELDELELPCEEEVWAAPRAYVEKYWSESASSGGSLSERGSESHDVHDDMDAATGASDTTQPPTVRIAQSALFKGEQVRYSSYATRVMITVLFYEVWNHRRTVAALQDVVIEFKLRLALDAWESGLRAKIAEEQAKMHERCRLLADDHARPDSAGQWGPSRSAPLMPPLLANSLAIYRVSRIRLAIDLKPVQEALRYHSPYEIAATMTVARQLVKRDPAARIEDAVRDCPH
ncbi:hypothetical protein KEM52_002030 [Ascosphaera acerosa]|nr:hypothetical protein KEM52_002030 [Ascosphaera acerosa]